MNLTQFRLVLLLAGHDLIAVEHHSLCLGQVVMDEECGQHEEGYYNEEGKLSTILHQVVTQEGHCRCEES